MYRKLIDNRFARPVKEQLVRNLVRATTLRGMLNTYYLSLNPGQRSKFHVRYAKIFRNNIPSAFNPGEWVVVFAGKQIKLPLRPETLWLDWDAAVSIVGHDVEIKQTYANLIASAEKPDLFLDIGANYGTHSLLFMSHGIPTVSFEPNSACFSYYEAVCALNGLKPTWEQLALGSQGGSVDLVFPERDTWLGSTSPEIVESLKSLGPVRTAQVRVVTIDKYLQNKPALADMRHVLIKIDVEGAEIDVLEGGRKTIQQRKPRIIFESNNQAKRGLLHRTIVEIGYVILPLPWSEAQTQTPLSAEAFIDSYMTNFISVPR